MVKYRKPKWGVFEGDILRAAQPTKAGAMFYMKPSYKLKKINRK